MGLCVFPGGEQVLEVAQVEGGAGIGFAGGGDVLVGGDVVFVECGEGGKEYLGQAREALVLAQGVGVVVAAGQFDADGEVVAVVTALVVRDAGVPGAAVDGDVLADVTVAGDVKMRGDLQVGDAVEIGVFVAVFGQCAEKQGVNVAGGVFVRRQADVVQNQGVNGAGARVVEGAFKVYGVV